MAWPGPAAVGGGAQWVSGSVPVVGGVSVPIDQVVDVVAMRHRDVPAALAVGV